MTRGAPVALTGRTLGDFTVLEKLGEGGFGVVHRAEQRGLGREAVVKVLHARLGGSERAVQRFLREAQLASRLDHPYAAHIYAFGAEPDGVLWIAMELVRGTPLSKVLAAQPGRRMPLTRWVPLFDRICEVVHTAHEQGIVHRDLKPDNIDPTEVEAGAATPASSDVRLTQAGARVGSPLYMAPEQWTDGEIDARTDLYALGVITYEALVGSAPFGGATVVDIACAHLRDDVPPFPAELPDGIAAAVRGALAKERDARPASVLVLAEAVRAASGLRVAADALPRLDEGLRQDTAWLPQPIAEVIGALEGARNPHQARDALWEIVHVAARWLGVVALAARSRVGPGPGQSTDAPAVVDALRELHRRELADDEWIDLVRALVRPFAAVRDAYPVPELIDLALAEASPFAPLFALRAAEATGTSEESLREWLVRTLPVLTPLVRALGFLTDYQLVVAQGGAAELWMGPRRPRRAMLHVVGELAIGEPALVDLDGRPVLALAPLVAVASPAPGAAEELFVFAGPGRARGRGAQLVAEPHGFERHDDRVWDWFRDRLLSVEEGGAAVVEDAPYRGLAAFTAADAALFFGRERAAESFLNQLLVTPLLAVVGPSGAGKSSFVQAGVLPLVPPGWRHVVIRPGAAPMAVFESRVDLSSIAAVANETLVIVVDQFEELFTLCGDPGERERFAAALVEAARDERVRVVITLRDDFLVRAGELVALRDRLAQGLTLLATPAPDDLLRIVVEPARRAGYDFDDKDLPSRMVRAVAGQPGALALLSFTASQLWDLRDRHFKRLTRASYDAIGGVEGALAAHADATLSASSADEQRLVRDAFRHLVTAEGTRAVMTRRELDDVLGKSPHAAAVIERLVRARLLVASESESGDDRIEIIHEALITAWPRLVQWRRDDAEGARLRDQLRTAARQWADRDRARGLLWRDDALDDYRRWRTRWPGALPELDEAFATASLRDAARGRRLRRTLAATAATILVAATIGLSLLYRSSEHNAAESHDRLISSYIEQGRRLLLDGDYLRALPYLSAAYSAGDDSFALRFMLHRAMRLADTPTLATPIAVAAFRDDDHVMIVDLAGRAGVWSVSEQRELEHFTSGNASDAPVNFALARNGARAAITRSHDVAIWDGASVTSLPVAGVKRLAFDRDATRIAIATNTELSVWTVGAARPAWSSVLPAPPIHLVMIGDGVAAWLRDGKNYFISLSATVDLGEGERIIYGARDRFATQTATGLRVWDAHGVQVTSFDVTDPATATLSADGRLLAVGSSSGAISLFDVDAHRSIALLSGHRGQARVAFSPDGAWLVSAGEDGTVRIWDMAVRGQLVELIGTGSDPNSLSFDPSGRRVLVATIRGARVFALRDPSALASVDTGQPLGNSGFTRDGTRFFTTSNEGIEIWDATTGESRTRIASGAAGGGHVDDAVTRAAIPLDEPPSTEIRDLATGTVTARLPSTVAPAWASFDHAGTRVVTTDAGGGVDLWNVGGAHLRTLRGHSGAVFAAAFDPSDRRLATAGYDDRTARIWDLDSGRELGRVSGTHGFSGVAFDGSGSRLLTVADNRLAQIWDATSFRLIRSFEHETSLRAAAIRADGALVAGATRDGTVSVWDVANGKEVARLHHAGGVTGIDFSPDGRRLLSSSYDHLAIVWDVAADVPARDVVASFVRCHAPYELRGTSLEGVELRACR